MGERLAGEIAIVTGAGARGPGVGNGKAAAILMAREGARVLCVDAQKDRAEETVDVLVLKAISWGPRHGHGVARVIRDSTSGTLDVTDGSLYVALHRLEERGLVDSEWGLSDKGKRARFYRLTTAGRQRLKTETAAWQRYVQTVTRLLTATTQPA